MNAPTTRPDWTDRTLELEVGPIAHGGHCVARVPPADASEGGGRVVFVRHALPGERVLAIVSEDNGGGFCRADAVTVLEPAPGRVDAPCDWARAGGCGGCDLQHADHATQRTLKTAVLAEQLQRLAGITTDAAVEELPGGTLGWRHRVRLAVDGEGRAGLRAHRSHDVLPIADCPIAPGGALPGVLAEHHRPGGELEVVADADEHVHVDAVAVPAFRSGRAQRRGDVVEDPDFDGTGYEHHRAGAGHRGRDEAARSIVVRAAGREWRLTPGTFWQVHPALPDTLAGVVRDWAAAPTGGVAWDLFGGVGLFGAVLAEQVGRDGHVTVVESSVQAVDDGRAALADLPQIAWRAGRVDKVLTGLGARPDVVVADPPRKGLGKGLVDALAEVGPDRIVHVACDPAALARDVALFADRGYELTELRAFDAFPMTHHFESVALLTRT